MTVTVDRLAGAIAERQLGVLTRQQARWAKINPKQIERRLESGSWIRLYPNVYRLDGTPKTWHQRLVAAGFWARRGYAFSHRTAAALWGFTRFTPLPDEEPIELVTTRNLRWDSPDPLQRVTAHQVAELARRDIGSVAQFRVTSVTRTLLDLAAREPWPDLRAAIDQALSRRWTTLERLEVGLQEKRRGAGPIRKLVRDYRGGDAPSESELEARVLEVVEAGGLPKPRRQRAIVVAGKLRRMDFWIPGTPLLIEADGYAYHFDQRAFEADRRRDNALAARGFVVLHWTWRSIKTRPEELVWEALQIIAKRWADPREPAPSARSG